MSTTSIHEEVAAALTKELPRLSIHMRKKYKLEEVLEVKQLPQRTPKIRQVSMKARIIAEEKDKVLVREVTAELQMSKLYDHMPCTVSIRQFKLVGQSERPLGAKAPVKEPPPPVAPPQQPEPKAVSPTPAAAPTEAVAASSTEVSSGVKRPREEESKEGEPPAKRPRHKDAGTATASAIAAALPLTDVVDCLIASLQRVDYQLIPFDFRHRVSVLWAVESDPSLSLDPRAIAPNLPAAEVARLSALGGRTEPVDTPPSPIMDTTGGGEAPPPRAPTPPATPTPAPTSTQDPTASASDAPASIPTKAPTPPPASTPPPDQAEVDVPAPAAATPVPVSSDSEPTPVTVPQAAPATQPEEAAPQPEPAAAPSTPPPATKQDTPTVSSPLLRPSSSPQRVPGLRLSDPSPPSPSRKPPQQAVKALLEQKLTLIVTALDKYKAQVTALSKNPKASSEEKKQLLKKIMILSEQLSQTIEQRKTVEGRATTRRTSDVREEKKKQRASMILDVAALEGDFED